jgi:hypothetical protein
MAKVHETKVEETRKAWGTPQLKKFGIEEITASFHGGAKTDSKSTHS